MTSTPTPLPRSSGDMLADRRADYAEMLFGNGEPAAAAELMMGALELAPDWALGWFRLGEFQEAAAAPGQAAQAWRMTLQLDPIDRPGAALKLALIGRAPSPAAPPSAFVEALFDQYAPTFDASLMEKLGYRVPELLRGAIRAQKRERFSLAIDLGCGTGLMGELLRPFVDRLIGYDISTAMLKKAEAKCVYDQLEKADLQSFDGAGIGADLATAADVLMYIGALDGLVKTVAEILEPGGLFAFSVEAHDGADDFMLRPSRRYAHAESYIRRVLRQKFAVLSLDREVIRIDRNEPIEGLIVVARREG
ncbi:MAG: methyltransferase domain-containing protein [Rhizobiaceae bacterium]